ncbi:MAG: HAMP domain-containing histidine kinase [Desulfuromonadales bacterium]|nr:HAMP domain-containing histidine kinase [Desulfuromonadales bacterium]MBN2645026.1 HAMP domain-containing histidine kinase [Desulfuromonadaceae bacterium]
MDRISISVTDYGKGISSEDCSRLFRRFFPVKGQESGGTGLACIFPSFWLRLMAGISRGSMVSVGRTFSLALPIE